MDDWEESGKVLLQAAGYWLMIIGVALVLAKCAP